MYSDSRVATKGKRSFLVPASLLLACNLLGSGCRLPYVARLGFEQFRYLSRARPIAGEIEKTSDEQRRRRLSLVLELRDFAARNGLDPGDSYLEVADTKGLASGYVVTAAWPDRLEAYTWYYPIIGRIPYRGYFDSHRARAYAQKLEHKGLDTYVMDAAAYSTLGWFDDPLPSSLLELADVELATVVLHELLHRNVYVPGQLAFNETLASAVAGRLALRFFEERSGRSTTTGDAVEAELESAQAVGAAAAHTKGATQRHEARAVARGKGQQARVAGEGDGQRAKATAGNPRGAAAGERRREAVEETDSHSEVTKARKQLALWREQGRFCDRLAARLEAYFDDAHRRALDKAALLEGRKRLYENALPDLEQLGLVDKRLDAARMNNAVFLALYRYRRRSALFDAYLDGFPGVAEALEHLGKRLDHVKDPYTLLSATTALR